MTDGNANGPHPGPERTGTDAPPAPRAAGAEATRHREHSIHTLRVEIRDDVREARIAVADRVREDAARVRRAVRLLGHGTVAAVLVVHLLATAILSWIVLSNPVPHPGMYPLMGLVLWMVLASRFTALLAGRKAAAVRGMIANLLLHAFWLWVLIDQVGARRVVDREVLERAPMPVLLVPLILYGLAMAGMILHSSLLRRHERLAREAGGD